MLKFWTNWLALPLFLAATCFNARLRLQEGPIHLGGAELSISPYDFALFLLFLLFLIERITGSRRARINYDALNGSFLLFISLSAISLVNSVSPAFTLYELFRHLKVFFLFLLLRRIFSESGALKPLTASAAIIIIFELLYVAGQLALGATDVTEDAAEVKELFVEGGVTRVSGTLRHPTLLSLYINLLLPFVVLGAVHFRPKLLYFAAIAAGFLVIVLTYTRTQIILYVFVCVCCLMAFRSTQGSRLIVNRRAVFAITAGALSAVMIALYNFETLYERFLGAPESSTTSRLILAQIALEMFSQHPIIGIGWNTFVDAMPAYDEFGAYRIFRYPVHNMYLLILSETGILGLGAFFIIIWQVFRHSKSANVALSDLRIKNASRAAAISFGVMLITGLQGWSFRADSIQAIMWMSVAVVGGIHSLSRSQRRDIANENS